MNVTTAQQSALRAAAVMLLACASFFTLQATKSGAQTLPAGVTELKRVPNIDVGNSVVGMTANRQGDMATVYHTNRSDDFDVVFYHNSGEGLREAFVPDGSQTLRFTFSNWGISAQLYFDAGTPVRVVVGRVDGPIEHVANGVSGEPFINDAGGIVYRAQGALYSRQPGGELQQLPSLGSVGVTEYPVMDSSGRVIARHSFQEFPTSESSDIYRYESANGWTNLTSGLEAAEYPWELADSRFPHVNAAGDYLFQSTVSDPNGNRYYLNHFDSATNTIERLADLTVNLPNGETAGRQVQAGIADGSEILMLLGSDNPGEWDLIFRRADESTVQLNELLPANEFFPADPSLTQYFMTNSGMVLLLSRNSLSGDYSYHVYDDRVAGIYTIPELSMLPRQYSFPTLTDDGNVYIWLDDQPETVLGAVSVPEPQSLLLAAVAVLAIAATWRPRWRQSCR